MKVLSDRTLRLLLKRSGVKTTNYNTFLPFSENLRLLMAVISSTSHLSKHLNDLAISSKKNVFLTAVTTEAYDQARDITQTIKLQAVLSAQENLPNYKAYSVLVDRLARDPLIL